MRRALALLLSCAGCGDDDQVCGNVLDAGASGVTAVTGAETITYGNFAAVMGGDCGMGEASRESVSFSGRQLDPAPSASRSIAFCLEDRADIGTAPITVTDPLVWNLFLAGEDSNGCILTIDDTMPPTGTITFAGFCAPGGMDFSMTFDLDLPAQSMCPTDGGAPTPTPIAPIALTGTVSVTGYPSNP